MLKKVKRTLALAALMAGAAGVAHATEGWYGRADVGSSVGGDLDGSVSDGSTTGSFSPDLEDNVMGSIGLGYAMQHGFRLEGELAYRNNDWGPTFIPDPPDGDYSGNVKSWALMANLYYDFNRGGRVEPYVGIGIGGAHVETSIDGLSDETDTVLAYQAQVGVAFRLSQRASLDLAYRYFAAPDVDMSGAWANPTYSSDADYTHQAVTLGLRWQFHAPSPPPPVQVVSPPPPPPPPRPVAVACPTADFVVYFEWDRSNLNQAALDTIDSAASRARQCNIGGVVVVGHTDTSGSAQYNIGLSERRASVVRDALVARGISAASIQTQAHGETDLARATRDGVREPLNRRTAVTISFR